MKILAAAAAGVVSIVATAVFLIKDLPTGTTEAPVDVPEDETPKEEPTA